VVQILGSIIVVGDQVDALYTLLSHHLERCAVVKGRVFEVDPRVQKFLVVRVGIEDPQRSVDAEEPADAVDSIL
jgi:hypothetical protein